jgi:nucleotide-binding universal stress UspA family protein
VTRTARRLTPAPRECARTEAFCGCRPTQSGAEARESLGFISSYPGDPDLTAEAEAAAKAETDKVLAALGSSRPESVTISGVNGIPAGELIKAGEGADMIVLGSRGAGGLCRLSMGSVAAQVAQHAPCPVVIVRPPHRD